MFCSTPWKDRKARKEAGQHSSIKSECLPSAVKSSFQKNADLSLDQLITFETPETVMADTNMHAYILCLISGRETQIPPPEHRGRWVWCSPVWTQGDVEQNEQHCSYYGCQHRSHPGAKLAEVAVLHNGDQNGTTHKHGVLQQRERARVSFVVLTAALLHKRVREWDMKDLVALCDMHTELCL